MCTRFPIGRKDFALALSLCALLLASGGARGADLGIASGDGEASIAPAEPDAGGLPQLSCALEARLRDVLEQKTTDQGAEALTSLEARVAERTDERMRTVAARVEQDLARDVERRVPRPPSGSEDLVVFARREVLLPSAVVVVGTDPEVVTADSAPGGPDATSTTVMTVAHSPAITFSELPLDRGAWCSE